MAEARSGPAFAGAERADQAEGDKQGLILLDVSGALADEDMHLEELPWNAVVVTHQVPDGREFAEAGPKGPYYKLALSVEEGTKGPMVLA